MSPRPLDTEELLSQGETAIRKVSASRADEGEVFIQSGWGRSYTLEGGSIKYGSYGSDFGIGIRVLRGGRMGFGYCTRMKDLSKALKGALSMCRISPSTKFTFPGPDQPKKTTRTYDPGILTLEDNDGLEMMSDMLNGALGVSKELSFPGGGVGFGLQTFCVNNTRGISVADQGTFLSAGLSTMIGKEGTPNISTGSFDDFSRDARLDAVDIGRRAATLAVDSRGAKPLDKPGTMDVVLAPDAFSELAEHLLASSFYGERAARAESYYSDKLGQSAANRGLSILEDGLLAGGPNTCSVDDEGVPTRRTSLMSKGVVRSFLYDTASAEEYGGTLTGNGTRVDRLGTESSFKVTPKTRARNLVMKWDRRRSLDDIIGEVKNGVYVHELLGSHTANTISGDFSIGSPLLFRIRKGELAGPLQGVMLAGNFYRALMDMGGLADDHRNVTGSLSSVAVKTPSVWLRGINVMK